METKPYQIYQSMMIEIKIRIRAIDKAINESKSDMSPLMIEFCFLQSRKIIEQVCFSAILCDKNRYEDFRKLEGLTSDKDHGNFCKDWNARVILNKLKDITPHFLPRPLGERVSTDGQHHFKEGFTTTHSELIKMWKNCGSFLHIPRPFGENYESHITKQKQKYKASIKTLKEYSAYFKKLLWNHAAIGLEYQQNDNLLDSDMPANPVTAWLIHFGEYDSDFISITLAEAR